MMGNTKIDSLTCLIFTAFVSLGFEETFLVSRPLFQVARTPDLFQIGNHIVGKCLPGSDGQL